MNVNQATKLIIVILLFMSVGGFQREGVGFLVVCSCMCYYWNNHSNRSRIPAGEDKWGIVNED